MLKYFNLYNAENLDDELIKVKEKFKKGWGSSFTPFQWFVARALLAIVYNLEKLRKGD
jgi:hypothetical protein